jgi:phospholipid/cholesterol/gamma-HCH transport system substrate-binding protein
MENGMEREANYAAVGAFMLLLLVMGSLFIYWYTDSRDQRNYTRYEIYFDGSVSGLSEGGAVRYLGVDVGKVWRIRLDQRAADRVMAIVDIDSTTPVSPRTLAQLSLQGVTGLLYIDLLQERTGATQKVLAAVPGVQYPVIRSVRSNFDTFVSSLPDIAARVGELAVRANNVFSDQNIAAVSRLVTNLDRAGAELPEATRNTAQLVRELRAAAADSRVVIQELQGAVQTAAPDLAATMERLRVTGNNMAQASARLDAMIAENRADVRSFARDGLPQIEALVRDARAAAQEFQQLSRTLRENPSKIIYQPAISGVEIPR